MKKEVKQMQKANGILVTKNDDYNYIDRFIDFLDRIIGIIIKLFDKLGGLDVSFGKKDETASDATATPTN